MYIIYCEASKFIYGSLLKQSVFSVQFLSDCLLFLTNEIQAVYIFLAVIIRRVPAYPDLAMFGLCPILVDSLLFYTDDN